MLGLASNTDDAGRDFRIGSPSRPFKIRIEVDLDVQPNQGKASSVEELAYNLVNQYNCQIPPPRIPIQSIEGVRDPGRWRLARTQAGCTYI